LNERVPTILVAVKTMPCGIRDLRRALADRLKASGKAASLVLHPTAGHRVLLPAKPHRDPHE